MVLKKGLFYNNICDHYSRAETNQGRKVLIIKRFLLWKLFKGGNYSRAETIRGNTVFIRVFWGYGKVIDPKYVLSMSFGVMEGSGSTPVL